MQVAENRAETLGVNIQDYLKRAAIDSEVSTEPTDEVKKRWFYWNKLVMLGRKKSYQGLPEPVVVFFREERDENGDKIGVPVYDYSKQNGAIKKIAKRRAKNKVAKQSRKANR